MQNPRMREHRVHVVTLTRRILWWPLTIALLVVSCAQTPATSAAPTPTVPAVTYGALMRFTSTERAYRIDLPTPFHRSTCQSDVLRDVFVSVPDEDEFGTDMGFHYPAIEVYVEANPGGLSARDWIAHKPQYGVGWVLGQQREDTVLDG